MSETKPKPSNPACGECSHPFTFHPRDQASHRRKCKAFGCKCKSFVKSSKPAEEN